MDLDLETDGVQLAPDAGGVLRASSKAEYRIGANARDSGHQQHHAAKSGHQFVSNRWFHILPFALCRTTHLPLVSCFRVQNGYPDSPGRFPLIRTTLTESDIVES